MQMELIEGYWKSKHCDLAYFLKHIEDKHWEIKSLLTNQVFDLDEDFCRPFVENNYLVKELKELNKKFIKVDMPDESIWLVPCKIIAEDKAKYYSESYNESYEDIYKETMDDFDLLIDWGENNIDWDDIKEYAKCIRTGKSNIDWCNAEKRLVESEDYII